MKRESARRVVRSCGKAPSGLRDAMFEGLEERRLLATFVVDNLSVDDENDGNVSAGQMSLREAVLAANATPDHDTILFSADLDARTLVLSLGQLAITENLTIRGYAPSGDAIELGLSGGNAQRLFYVTAGVHLTLENLTLTEGFSANEGGAIHALGNLTLIDSVVSDSSGSRGGAIYAGADSTVTLTRTTLRDNTASTLGGGGITALGTLIVNASTLSGNTAVGSGGGIESLGSATLTGLTLSGNTAQGNGGGLFASTGTLLLRHSTLTLNRADSDNSGGQFGGGLSIGTATATLNSTLIAGNYRGIGVATSDDVSGSITGTHNLIGDAGTAGGLVNNTSNNIVGAIPMLGPLALNGGPVQNHALLEGSPAINKGTNAAGLVNDARGGRFIRNFGGGVDIGAYERQTLTLSVAVMNDLSNGDSSNSDLSIREAIDLANQNPVEDTITFASGLSGTITLTQGQLEITRVVRITGPGAQTLTIDAAGNSRIFMIDDPSGSMPTPVMISGLTLTGGSASGGGGAILSLERLTIFDIVITGNQADEGGAIYASSQLIIADATLSDNTASGIGGAIAHTTLVGAPITIVRTTLSGNTAGDLGGAVSSSGAFSAMTLIGVRVLNNTASGSGAGGVAAFGTGALSILDSTFDANTITSGHAGGGLFINGPFSTTITASTFSANASHGDAGAIFQVTGELLIRNSTLSGNTARGDGGGLYVYSGTASIRNTTITLNIADSDNNAPSTDQGGGIFNAAASGSITLISTIVAANRNGAGSGSDIAGNALNTAASTHNLIGHASTAGGLVNATSNNIVGADPKLAPLAFNGNLTATHNLLPGSPAISKGINPDSLETDQYGWNRVRGKGTDIGSRESDIVPTVTVSIPTAMVSVGQVVPVTITPFDQDGTIDRVVLYWDANKNGQADAGEFLATVNDTGTTWTYSLTVPQGVTSTTGLVVLAIAIDDDDNASQPAVSQMAPVNALPIFSPLEVSRTEVPRGGTLTVVLRDVTDPDGSVRNVKFYFDANADGIPDANELFRIVNTTSSNNYGASFTAPLNVPVGQLAILAVVTDNTGATIITPPALIEVTNIRPTVGSHASISSYFGQGDFVTLTAGGVVDPDGSVSQVRFYYDANADGVADPDELLGFSTDASNNFRFTITREQSRIIPVGQATFLAVAVDNDAGVSNPRPLTVNVVFSLLAQDGASVRGSAGTDDRFTIVTINQAGDPIVFDQPNWSARQFIQLLDAPRALDDAITWVDPKDNLTYAAYPSEDGLVLLVRSQDGVWSFRNLTNELDGSRGPVRALTQFTSTFASGWLVVIAGIDADGRLVAYQQTGEAVDDQQSGEGSWQFAFTDISASLDEGGFETPAYESLISYRTAWNAWHLAGLDTQGNIVSVWTAPNVFTQWRTDNLSATTGAPRLAGGLSVILTAWRGINLTGLNDSGEVVVTWWIPSFGGDWQSSNLTKAFNGPTFVGNGLTGYSTTWNGMNYAGRDANGQIVIYWWVPSFGGDWVVSTITDVADFTTPRPVGQLTSIASPAGTLALFGASENGDVIRAFWQPGSGGAWTLENLSKDAKRVSA